MMFEARRIVTGIPLVLLTLMSVTNFALGQAKSLKDQLVGHWQLASVTMDTRTPYGTTPTGSMFLDGGGHFSVIVISSGNARNVSYFGTYTVDDANKTMTLHIEGSSGGIGLNLAGHDQTRLVTISGDELTVQSQGPSGTPGNMKLIWKQAN
jgi:Lipocalin-like domain